jgi:NAD-dependent DNA ligase
VKTNMSVRAVQHGFTGFVHPKRKRQVLSFHDSEDDEQLTIDPIVNIVHSPRVTINEKILVFSGKKICLAGKLSKSRAYFEEKIKKCGGIFTKNVGKDVCVHFAYI